MFRESSVLEQMIYTMNRKEARIVCAQLIGDCDTYGVFCDCLYTKNNLEVVELSSMNEVSLVSSTRAINLALTVTQGTAV